MDGTPVQSERSRSSNTLNGIPHVLGEGQSRTSSSPAQSAARSTYWRWPAAVLLTLLLHYVWEMVQAPLFTNFAGASFWSHALPCFWAALGDVLIAFSAYAAAAAAFRRPAWPFGCRCQGPFTVCLLVGLAITIAFEYYALATGRWNYADVMPTVAGVGLSPLAQWIVVPSLTLVLLQWARHRFQSRT